MRRNAADPLDLLRLRLEERAELGTAIAAARQEADLRIEVLADLRVAARDLPEVVGEVVEARGRSSRCPGPVGDRSAYRCAPGRPTHAGSASDLDVGVDAVGAVLVLVDRVLADALPVHEDGAVARSPDLALHADHAEVVRRPDNVPAGVLDVVGLDVQQARRSSRRPCRSSGRRRGCRSAAPTAERPMRREKNRSICCGLPNWNVDAFSRKNGRFSGKNRSKRVRLTCSSSASTCAKSVLMSHRASGSDGFPTSRRRRRRRSCRPDRPCGAREVLVHRSERVRNQLDVAARRQVEARSSSPPATRGRCRSRAESARGRPARSCGGCCARTLKPQVWFVPV